MLRLHRGLKALTTVVCPSVCLSVYDQIEKVTARARHPLRFTASVACRLTAHQLRKPALRVLTDAVALALSMIPD